MERWMKEFVAHEIEKAYGMKIWATLPMRSVVGLATDHGRFICKRYGKKQGLSFERIKALVALKDQLALRGLCPSYARTRMGSGYVEFDGDVLTLEPWIAGKHADFSVRADRMRAVQAVARLHHAQIDVPMRFQNGQSLIQKFLFRLRKATEVVESGELMGLSYKEWEVYRDHAEHVLRNLPQEELRLLTKKHRSKGVLCHRDLAPHNILVQAGTPAVLIDFDLAGSDSPLYDLHQIFDHMIYRTGSLNWVDETLYAYLLIHPLALQEQKLLRQLLEFPTPLLREIGELQEASTLRAKKRVAMRIRYVNRLTQERLHACT